MVALVETQNTITTPSSESIQGFDKYLRMKSVQEFLQYAEEIKLTSRVDNGYWLGIDLACANLRGINFDSNTWLAKRMPLTKCPGGFLLAIDPLLVNVDTNAAYSNDNSSGSTELFTRIPNLTPIMVPALSNDSDIIDLLSNKADQVCIIAPDNSQPMNVIEMIENAYKMTKPGTGKLTIALDHLYYDDINSPEHFIDYIHNSLVKTGSQPLLKVNNKKYSKSYFWLIPNLINEKYLSQRYPHSFWFNPEEADENVLVIEISKQPKHIPPHPDRKTRFSFLRR